MPQSLAQKLRLFIEKLSAQSCVYVKEKTFNPGATEAQLKNVWPHLPDDVREFYKEMNGLTFEWHFSEKIKDGARKKNTGADFDGRIRLVQLNEKSVFRKNDSGYSFPKDLSFLMLDVHVPEAIGYLVFQAKSPYVAFARAAEENTPKKFGSFTEYIERAIENCFGWYWPFKERAEQTSYLEYLCDGKWSLPLEYEVALSDFAVISGDQYREQELKWKGAVAKKHAKALGLKTSLAVGPMHKAILEATKDIDALDNTTIRALLKATMQAGGSIEKSKAALKEYFQSPPSASGLMTFSVSLQSTEQHPGQRTLQPHDVARILSFCPQAKGLEVFFRDLPGYDEAKEKSVSFSTEPGYPKGKGSYTFQAKLPIGHIPAKEVKYTVSFV